MSMSKTAKARKKAVREGKLDTTISRQTWQRKPQTQVVKNGKAYNRKRVPRGGDEYAC